MLLRACFQAVVNALTAECILCHDLDSQHHGVCAACYRALPWQTQREPNWFSAFHYTPPISTLITDFKFYQKIQYAPLLGGLLADALKQHYTNQPKPTLILPVPLHRARLRARGFNQSQLIAKQVARHLNLPIDLSHCARIRNTRAQTELSANARKKNLNNAFKIKTFFYDAHIAILDDVITTGSTAQSLRKALQKAGAARVDIWSCAHG